jgi:hypothetical protein
MHPHVFLAAWITEHWADVGTIVSIAIAFAAAFRPELHSLFRPRKIEVILTDSYFVELGFDTFGPTMGLVGTLNNEHSKSVVTKLRVRVALPDGGEYVFSPVQNRVQKFGSAFPGGGDVQSTLWLPFLIPDDVAVPFDLLLRNDVANVALTSIGYDLGKAWGAYARADLEANQTVLKDADPNREQANHNARLIALFNASQQQPFMLQAREAIANTFPWRPGSYRARLEVEVFDCKRVFASEFNFALSKEQCEQLIANVDRLLAAICQFTPSTPILPTISKITI